MAPTYAELPFEFNSGVADIEATDGFYQNGLGTDYNASTNPNTQLKFDGTGDWLLLQFDERPGTLTFDIKGNNFIGGTFTVQTSENGTTYSDLKTYTSFGSNVESEEFTNLGENVRYIKWIYTTKAQGNVGLGNITLAEYEEPVLVPSITINPDHIDVDANEHVLEVLPLTYENMEITGLGMDNFTTQFYDAEGEETEDPEWCSAGVIAMDEGGYQVQIIVHANEGEARSAYFKVYAYDAENNPVYSNLVTINQAAAPQQYTLTVEPFENLEIITFVNDEMVMEADGEIEVNDGDHIMLSIVADEGYVMETLMVNGVNHVNDIAEDFTYEFDMPAEAVTISATAVEYVAPTPGNWVLTNLADLTEDDVFVIVGTANGNTYAMPNVGECAQGAPCVIAVTVVEGTLSEEPDAELQWNLGITEDGYIFYPNGDTENWLYCTNANNGVRVGDNVNNVFTMSNDGYLQHTLTGRYVGIFNAQDWRCYTNTTGNIAGQTFAFYKKMEEATPVTVTITGHTLETTYDGESHSVSGYDVEISDPLYKENDFTFTGTVDDSTATGIDVGTTNMNLEGKFQNTNPAFDVTFLVTNGTLTITKAEMTVTVTGNTATKTYNGHEQSVTGYTLSCDNTLCDESLVIFTGEAKASGTDEGTYPMGLEESQFSYNNDNIDVMFNVTDGYLIIAGCPTILVDAQHSEWRETFEDDVEANGGYAEGYDANGLWTGVTPACWDYEMYTSASLNQIGNQLDTVPQVYRSFNTTEGGHYSLRMHYKALLTMPELDANVDLGKIRLSMYVRQSYWRYQLQVGVVTTDGEFHQVAMVNNPDKTKTYFECGFESVKNLMGEGRRIAFMNIGSNDNDPYSVNYLDDITLTYVDEEACLVSPGTVIDFEDMTNLSGATGVEPKCWEVITPDVELTSTTKPQLYRGYNSTDGGYYSLRMMNRCVYAMPEFDEEYPIENLTMTLKLRQPNSLYRLQVGVVDEQGTFHPVKTLKSGTTMEAKTVSFANYTGSGRIAFRNTLVPGTGMSTDYLDYSYNYIDDINITLAERAKIDADDENVLDADLESIAVYPNPTTDYLNVECTMNNVQSVEMIDVYGKVVRTAVGANNYSPLPTRINVSGLAAGMYFVRVTTDRGAVTKPFVKR